MTVTMERPNPKQEEFFRATARYVGYGGARGGGKSWSVRGKARLLALNYPGIRILILRRTFPELRENHINPLLVMTRGMAVYKASDKVLTFVNGSVIIFGYCAADADVLQYQGNEYDVIFMDEATQFSEFQFSALTASLRGANDFPKRFYLTCNPGGIGHAWVKRLFIDREYRRDERPEDYVFIRALVTDNPVLMAKDPGYIQRLRNLPPGQREAWLEGSWDVFAGQYFTEWSYDAHVVGEPFTPPEWWRWYVTMDYGLDMLAAYLIAVDERERAWVVREVREGKDLGVDQDGVLHEGLTVSQAADKLLELAAGHQITAWLAPPDLWNRQSHTGKSTADLFAQRGIGLTRANSERVAGWLAMKEFLHLRPDGAGGMEPGLRIFPGCEYLIRCLPLLRYDEKNPSDTAREPHWITHGPDAIRYFCASWTIAGEAPVEPVDDGDRATEYEDYMTGGAPPEEYLSFEGWGV